MIENYNKAKKYLYKIDPILYRDILHDAYINYHRRTGLNLFERENTNVIGVVKNQYFEYLRTISYKRGGERLSYVMLSYNDELTNRITPEDYLIGQETYQIIVNRLNSFEDRSMAQAVLDLKLQGFDDSCIAQELSLTKTQVKRYISNLKKDRPGKTRIKPSQKEEVINLSSKGLSISQICNKTGLSLRTVWLITNDKTKKSIRS